MTNAELNLLKTKIHNSETKIKLIDELLSHGTLEDKMDFLLSRIRDKEEDEKIKYDDELRREEVRRKLPEVISQIKAEVDTRLYLKESD